MGVSGPCSGDPALQPEHTFFAQTLRRRFLRVYEFTFEWCLAGGDEMSLS